MLALTLLKRASRRPPRLPPYVVAPSVATTALIGAIPLILAIVAMTVFGVETKKKQLERISAEELHQAAPTG